MPGSSSFSSSSSSSKRPEKSEDENENDDEEDCQNLIFRRAPRPPGARHHLIFRQQTSPCFRPVCAKPRRRTRAFSGRSQPVLPVLFLWRGTRSSLDYTP